ncbi:MAG TPA: hypothetical protein PKE26_08870 [Kiritimatiellia bacterium]|nr:hypothetical protein [Kiritimatiellia bacterium]HMO99208.1 hypothetical protein [Kiritimatiellia bacterium]HMP95999.1 hypothetical protein [Kiritimatiellia bacterium]
MSLLFALFLLTATASAVTTNDARRITRERLWHRQPLHHASADLRAELDDEITRLLDRHDAAGRLKPSYFSIGITGSWILHGYPGEQAYILADALPFLSTTTQARVKAYLHAEIRARDPTSIAFEHCDGGWGSCQMTGNRREYFSIPTSPNPDPITPNLWPPPAVQPEGLYMIWRYCDRTEDWAFISTNSPPTGDRWNRMNAMFNAIPNPPTRYGHLAAAIGYARILEHYGFTNGAPYTTALERVHAGMLAGANFSVWVDASYNAFVYGTHDWAWTPFHYLRNQNAVGAMLAPEVGRFLGEFAYSHVYRRTTRNPNEGQPGELYAIESIWNGWYLTRGPYAPLIAWMGYYGENHMVTPDTPWALFMTHAWVYGESGDELRRWLDVPYNIGDLFHIQRLTATIGAYSDPVWSAVQPPALRAEALETGPLRIIASGASNALYAIDRSTNLIAWQSVITNAGPEFMLTNQLDAPLIFFRARTAP